MRGSALSTRPSSDRADPTPIDRLGDWTALAKCRGAAAPPMFVDQWGTGRDARHRRVAALATCRTCTVRRECGLAALADVDAGMSLYGVLCGVEFTDVTPCRQEKDVARLRAVVTKLVEAATAPDGAFSRRERPV